MPISQKHHSPQCFGLHSVEETRSRKIWQSLFSDVAISLFRHRTTGFLSAMKIIPKAELTCEDPEETEKMKNQFIR